ncbi:unnamed protein product [Mytilus coruscus]|uniref:Reverse transcriptase/retrotransposon-derived protein RNase H-like domain-containing protein n=1 Tax=Mytilus coruscus TaxID=42192 RepID=A0A6J8EJA7_MYTCO|nr:unnamed protein product [Mytilus coruscus]
MGSYYRRFIKDLSAMVKPLTDITKKSKSFEWTEECQIAFEKLKQAFTSTDIMAFPRDEGEYYLDTDACDTAIGAVLSQIQEGTLKVIAYDSRTLNKAERNNCITDKELLAICRVQDWYHQKCMRKILKIKTQNKDCGEPVQTCTIKTRKQTSDDNIWTSWSSGYSKEELLKLQEDDPDIGPLLQWKKCDTRPSSKREEHTNWDLNLGCLASAYRACPHDTTNLTPNVRMLGREIRFPFELTREGTEFVPETEEATCGAHALKVREEITESTSYSQKTFGCQPKKKERSLRCQSQPFPIPKYRESSGGRASGGRASGGSRSCQDTAEPDSEPQQESVITPLASPVRRIVEREQALDEESGEQQPDEFVFEQQTTTTHPSEEWNMVPTPAGKTTSSSSSSSSSSECFYKLLLDKLTVQFSNFSDKVCNKMENMQQEISRLTSQVTGLRSVVHGQNQDIRRLNISPSRNINQKRFSPYRSASRNRSTTPMPKRHSRKN